MGWTLLRCLHNKLLCINMRYRISKENIEWLAEAGEQSALVKAIVKVLVPKFINKLYFYSPDNDVRDSVDSVANETVKGLVVMDESGVDTFHRYKQWLHYASSISIRGCQKE